MGMGVVCVLVYIALAWRGWSFGLCLPVGTCSEMKGFTMDDDTNSLKCFLDTYLVASSVQVMNAN